LVDWLGVGSLGLMLIMKMYDDDKIQTSSGYLKRKIG
jgi:hypothetical protein